MSTPDILCLGEAMVEFTRRPDGLWQQGFGGDTSNAAIAAARQGASVSYLTALGTDRFGDALTGLWAREGIDTSTILRDPDAATGIYFVDPDPAERHFTYYRAGSAASRYGPGALPHDRLSATRILHLSGITLAVSAPMRAAGLAAMQAVRAAGGQVSLDTNLRLKLWPVDEARAVLEQAMAHATVTITSIDDQQHLSGLTAPEAIIAHLKALGPQIVLVTLGGDGAMVGTPQGLTRIPPAPAEPVDSTGAGDSFAGAFLAYWLETGEVTRAATLAARVAAGTVSGYGAVDPIPHRAAISP